MAANRKKLIYLSSGGVVLALMLLAASFSLGVYVGEHGWTRDGLSFSGPGGRAGADNRPPPNGGLPNGPALQQGQPQAPQVPAGLPSGKPNLTGRILRILPQGIQVAAADGPRLVALTGETRFLEQSGAVIQLADLQIGDRVAVYGIPSADGAAELRAEFVVRLPEKQ
jgi:hypothetical protein